jgi:hypothetical protein
MSILRAIVITCFFLPTLAFSYTVSKTTTKEPIVVVKEPIVVVKEPIVVVDPDSDGDGTKDSVDECDRDASKIVPGICGCGVVDTDSDGDGLADCVDTCPKDAAATKDGCPIKTFVIEKEPIVVVKEPIVVVDPDSDGDGTKDSVDGCDSDASKIAPGVCGCGVADTDSDGDGLADCVDSCPTVGATTSDGCLAKIITTTDKEPTTITTTTPTTVSKVEPEEVTTTTVKEPTTVTTITPIKVIDSDGDGVADGIDQCPDTKLGMSVNENGCVITYTAPIIPVILLDSDGDGVYDKNDDCPDTAEDATVDEQGCPIYTFSPINFTINIKTLLYLPSTLNLITLDDGSKETSFDTLDSSINLKISTTGIVTTNLTKQDTTTTKITMPDATNVTVDDDSGTILQTVDINDKTLSVFTQSDGKTTINTTSKQIDLASGSDVAVDESGDIQVVDSRLGVSIATSGDAIEASINGYKIASYPETTTTRVATFSKMNIKNYQQIDLSPYKLQNIFVEPNGKSLFREIVSTTGLKAYMIQGGSAKLKITSEGIDKLASIQAYEITMQANTLYIVAKPKTLFGFVTITRSMFSEDEIDGLEAHMESDRTFTIQERAEEEPDSMDDMADAMSEMGEQMYEESKTMAGGAEVPSSATVETHDNGSQSVSMESEESEVSVTVETDGSLSYEVQEKQTQEEKNAQEQGGTPPPIPPSEPTTMHTSTPVTINEEGEVSHQNTNENGDQTNVTLSEEGVSIDVSTQESGESSSVEMPLGCDVVVQSSGIVTSKNTLGTGGEIELVVQSNPIDGSKTVIEFRNGKKKLALSSHKNSTNRQVSLATWSISRDVSAYDAVSLKYTLGVQVVLFASGEQLEDQPQIGDWFDLSTLTSHDISLNPLEQSSFEELLSYNGQRAIVLLEGSAQIVVADQMTSMSVGEYYLLPLQRDESVNVPIAIDNKITIAKGWNLLALPSYNSSIDSLDIYSSIASMTYLYGDKTWSKNATTIGATQGVWVKSDDTSTISFTGTQELGFDLEQTKSLESGWHLLGTSKDMLMEYDSYSNIQMVYIYNESSWIKNPNIINKAQGFWLKIE